MTSYRNLRLGETIQAGDEIDRCGDAWRDDPKWEPVHTADVGRKAPDPRYPSHRLYRRLVTHRDCPCVHETCTDGRICDCLKRDTAGPDGDRPEIGRELTKRELAEIHDMGD